MDLIFKRKSRESSAAANQQFYVEFLGWLPCRGIRGSIYTNAVGHELLQRKKTYPDVPKMTLQVFPNEIRVSNNNPQDQKKDKNITFFAMNNVTFASCMSSPNADIAICIYFSYNPITKSMLHAHAYQFDRPSTASTFVERINKKIETAEHQDHVSKIEEQLRQDGLLQPGVEKPPPPPMNYNHHPPQSTPSVSPPEEFSDPEQDTQVNPDMHSMQAIASELKEKLQLRRGPLLLPPKDYDTVHRKQGRLNDISKRKCLNEVLVGRMSVEAAVAPGNMSPLEEEEEKLRPSQDQSHQPPIHYPAKIPSTENEATGFPTSTQSPPILRKNFHLSRNKQTSESFLSNSSNESDRKKRSSYSQPSPSSPTPVIPRGHSSMYESFPTLKMPDRGPVTRQNPDHGKFSPHHTRENSRSSTHSGVSSHSDPSSPKLVLEKEDFEIPPDYDQEQRTAKTDRNSAGFTGIYQDPHGIQGQQGYQGPQDYQRNKGYQGYQGTQFYQGLPDYQGYHGPQGYPGNQGPQSHQSFPGYNSQQGPLNYPGQQGPQNYPGQQGTQNYPGHQDHLNYPGQQGPQNYPGQQGHQNYPGQQGPQNYLGHQGPQNYPGQQGPQNYPGQQGPQNYPGQQGPQNYPGQQGPQNYPGQQGPQNYPGPQGHHNRNSANLYPQMGESSSDPYGLYSKPVKRISPVQQR